MNISHSDDPLPLFSVIIPVYNDYEKLRRCINALLKQTFPLNKTEIIIVDNNSKKIPSWVFSNDSLNFFKARKQSSYAARNVGINNSKGEILAFIDSDCIPDINWLNNAYYEFKHTNNSIIAGKIKFAFSERPSISEMLDATLHLKQEDRVKKKQIAATANLFVKKKVFDAIGNFPEIKSGGDTVFSLKATHNGFYINYTSKVIVYHYARKLIQLFKKRFRIGVGLSVVIFFINKSKTKKTGWAILKRIFKYLLPPKKNPINSKFTDKFTGYLLLWICKLLTSIGCLYGLFFLLNCKNSIKNTLRFEKKT